MGNKGTIKGLIIGFLALFAMTAMTNALYPLVSSIISANAGSNNLLMLNIAFALIGVGLILWIIKDGLQGSREYENYG